MSIFNCLAPVFIDCPKGFHPVKVRLRLPSGEFVEGDILAPSETILVPYEDYIYRYEWIATDVDGTYIFMVKDRAPIDFFSSTES